MGCLKNVTRSIFLTVITAGFLALGSNDFVRRQVMNFINPSHDIVLERAQKIGDFSKINEEFEIEKATGILGYNAVLAEHKASGQKMVVVDSGKKTIITQEDIKSPDVEKKLRDALSNFKYQSMAIEDFAVTDRGTMTSYGHEIPYVKFHARIKKLPIGEIGGIISVAKDSKGNDKVLISANERSRYSQLITNEFFKAVK